MTYSMRRLKWGPGFGDYFGRNFDSFFYNREKFIEGNEKFELVTRRPSLHEQMVGYWNISGVSMRRCLRLLLLGHQASW